MNATELADELERPNNWQQENNFTTRAATMLRQQQAEIEALKMDIHSLTYGERLTKYFNKPIAWMDKESNITMIGGIYPKKLEQYLNSLEARIVALESRPVKELTREDRLKLIGTLKWAEDLLREAGHEEEVSDVQDCLMILRKA